MATVPTNRHMIVSALTKSGFIKWLLCLFSLVNESRSQQLPGKELKTSKASKKVLKRKAFHLCQILESQES